MPLLLRHRTCRLPLPGPLNPLLRVMVLEQWGSAMAVWSGAAPGLCRGVRRVLQEASWRRGLAQLEAAEGKALWEAV